MTVRRKPHLYSLRVLVCALLGLAPWACSPSFSDCSETRTCPKHQSKDAGAAEATGGATGTGGISAHATGGTKAAGGVTSSGGNGPATGTGAAGAGVGGSSVAGANGMPDASGVGDASSGGSNDGAAEHKTPCDATHVDCDDNPSNGCEVDVSSDVDHCGGCDIVCASTGTMARSCASGMCKPSCDGTHLNCNGDGKDGCEVDAQSDTANCGACKHACSYGNAGSVSCTKGTCAPVCSSGFGDCLHPTAMADDGCETDLGSANNCGSCGHDCGGATCNLSSKCDPLTYGNGADGVESVVADATYVYWTQSDSGGGHVYRAPVRGGSPTPIMTTTGAAFDGVASDGTFVYVCDFAKNHFAIRRQALSTPGAGSVVSDNSDQSVYNPCPVVVDGTNVYWTDYGSRQMFKKPKDGTGIREALTLVLGSASLAIAVDATNVYFGSRPAFAPIIVGADGPWNPNTSLSYPSADSYYIAIDDRYAYYGTGNGLARMLKNNTGTIATLYQALVPDGPLVTDDTYLYYADHYGTSGIYKIPKTGGSPVQVSTDAHINALFVSGKALYWTAAGTGNSDGFVRKLAL